MLGKTPVDPERTVAALGFVRFERSDPRLVDRGRAELDHGVEQRFLRPEVVVGGGEVHARRIGERAHRCGGNATLREQLFRGEQDSLPGVFSGHAASSSSRWGSRGRRARAGGSFIRPFQTDV